MVLVRINKDRGFWLTVVLIDFVVAEHGWIAAEAYRHKTEKKITVDNRMLKDKNRWGARRYNFMMPPNRNESYLNRF